jgi:DNA-binding response OmpR family regulator
MQPNRDSAVRQERAPARVSEQRAESSGRKLELGPVCLELACFTVNVHGWPVALTRLEFDLLAYLMQNEDRVVPTKELVHEVMHSVHNGQSSSLRVHVAHLRRKLGSAGRLVETVRGRGLRFDVSAANRPLAKS